MKLSIAICTLLERTLDSIVRATQPTAGWELIVVNNNCTDGTEAMLERFAARLPLKRVFEAAPGLSNARNAAIKVASGDYLIWTDDDVLVGTDWLVA
jgi:glycosyltransferase involved in cell wall biosynthesis